MSEFGFHSTKQAWTRMERGNNPMNVRTYLAIIGMLVLALVFGVLLVSNATEFRLPSQSLKGDVITAYFSTGATGTISSGTPYIEVIWRMDHVQVRRSDSFTLTGELFDYRWRLKDSYTPNAVGLLTVTAASPLGGVTMEHTETVYVDDIRARIDALAQVISASPVTTATAIIVTGGTIIDRSDAGWGTRMYPRFVPSGGQGETVQSGLVYNLSTGQLETKYWADILDFISVVTGTVQAKIRTPLFDTYTEIENHITAQAYPSGWGGTRSIETPSFAKP